MRAAAWRISRAKSINLEKAAAEIHKVAFLVESLADDILEMDINPLILRPHSAIAAARFLSFAKKERKNERCSDGRQRWRRL